MTCAAGPPAAHVPGSATDADDGAFDVIARLPGVVRRGWTVELSVIVEGRTGIATFEESAIDFSLNGHGLRNPRVTPIGGEVSTSGFLGSGGTILARGRTFGSRSRLGFHAKFDIDAEAGSPVLQYQIHATAFGGGAKSVQFVRNYTAEVK